MLAEFVWIGWLDGGIVLAAALCAMSCALLGNFMVLRKMSMMGDALSHAVLPGLAAAFLITGSRGSIVMLLGAVIVGVLTALLTQLIQQLGKVDEGASMGVVFTSLFALGLILIRRAADNIDLDPGCVLYGVLEGVPLDTIAIGSIEIPRVTAVLAVMFAINVAFVAVLYKELKITSFDPGLATTLGINANVMHYLLMTLVAATTVASFEAVGSILVVAMLIVPAAAAHLLTDRLGVMILLSLVIAAASAFLGHLSAIAVPSWFGYGSTTTSGMMAAVAGLIFLGVMLASPRHGVLSKMIHRALLGVRIVGEDILGLLYRLEERRAAPAAVGLGELRQVLMAGPLMAWTAAWWLRRRGRLVAQGRGYQLTEAGRDDARTLLRSHRLWETYLAEQLNMPADHTHESAERLEHVTGPDLRQKLSETASRGVLDPQGKRIPDERQ